jgi:selenocysteine lyase/cysteine desulfurase
MISSELFDDVYNTILRFINAEKEGNSIVLTSNTTTALDMASSAMCGQPGDFLVSLMEHHSNDLPHRKRGKVIHFGLNGDGTLDMNDLEAKLKKDKIKLVAVTGASNVTGFLPDIHEVARLAHRYGARILVDAAQVLAHTKIDVKPNEDESHIDFLAAAGHKAYAPFGSAFLFGPSEILDNCEPYIPGGGTVVYVTHDDAYYTTSPDRHQGGTPNIAGAIALAESLKFLSEIGLDNIRNHEYELTVYALKKLEEIPNLILLGNIPAEKRLGVISFNIDGLNHDKVSVILNNEAAIATRNGCFCAHPYLHILLGLDDVSDLTERLKRGEEVDLPGAVRATFGIYNDRNEIDSLVEMLEIISNRKWKGEYEKIGSDLVCKELAYSVM